jgi:hypothetical protein
LIQIFTRRKEIPTKIALPTSAWERLPRIIDNWEVRDEPEHLKTIRDHLLRNEQRAGRWLGIYQQILQLGRTLHSLG